MRPFPPELQALFAAQDSLVSAAQLAQWGFPDSTVSARVTAGTLIRVLPGIYSTCGPPSPSARLRAVVLWAGPDAVLVARAAAFCWGMVREPPPVVAVSVTPGRRLSRQRGVRVLREQDRASDRRRLIRVSTLEDTALDLARAGDTDGLDWLARQRRLDVDALLRRLAQRGSRRGSATARRLVLESRTNPWSRAERELHRLLLRAGITGWRGNPRVRLDGRIFTVDVLFDDVPLVVEVDGRLHHGDAAAYERDRRNSTHFSARGWTVIRVTWRQLIEEPEWVLREIRAVIAGLTAAREHRNSDKSAK